MTWSEVVAEHSLVDGRRRDILDPWRVEGLVRKTYRALPVSFSAP